MSLRILLFSLATTVMQFHRACLASPVGYNLHKRAPITCLPIDPRLQISFRDCVGALNMMGQEAYNINQILSFGIGSGVDVSISGDPMAWEYGSCAVELQAQGNVPQLATWHNLRNIASDISHSCSMRHREGFSYIDRIGLDSSPAAVEEGPNLQIWVGPREVPDDMLDDFLHYLSEQGSCSANERDATQYTEITSQMIDSIATASSRFGPRRTLLNHTEPACARGNFTVPHNKTANGGP